MSPNSFPKSNTYEESVKLYLFLFTHGKFSKILISHNSGPRKFNIPETKEIITRPRFNLQVEAVKAIATIRRRENFLKKFKVNQMNLRKPALQICLQSIHQSDSKLSRSQLRSLTPKLMQNQRQQTRGKLWTTITPPELPQC